MELKLGSEGSAILALLLTCMLKFNLFARVAFVLCRLHCCIACRG